MKTKLVQAHSTLLIAAGAARRAPIAASAESIKQECERLTELVNKLASGGGDIGESMADLLKIQASKGNWDVDGYMHGLLNGMILFGHLFAAGQGLIDADAECPFYSAPSNGFPED